MYQILHVYIILHVHSVNVLTTNPPISSHAQSKSFSFWVNLLNSFYGLLGLQQHHEINSVRKRVIHKMLVLFWIELCEYLAKLQMTGWLLEFALQSKCILPHSALNFHRVVWSVMEATINKVMRCKKLLHPSNLECCICIPEHMPSTIT